MCGVCVCACVRVCMKNSLQTSHTLVTTLNGDRSVTPGGLLVTFTWR